MSAEVVVVPDPATLAVNAADRIAALLRDAHSSQGRASLAVSGGSGPVATLSRLAAAGVPWAGIEVFQVDERCVPPDDARSNWAMVERTLLDPAGVPAGHRHPMPVDLPPAEAAAAYEKTLLARLSEPPRLDVCLLGIGPDGHVASLFPGASSLDSSRWVEAAPGQWEPRVERITVTLRTINEARACVFLVPDESDSKSAVVARALAPTGSRGETPAWGVQPHDGCLVWFLTEAAAKAWAA